MIELARVQRAVLPERFRTGGAGDRFADQAGEGEHAEAVADAAQRVASSDRRSGFVRGHGQLMKMNSFELKRVFRYRPHGVTGSIFFSSSFFAAPGMTPAIMLSSFFSPALSSSALS